MTPHKLILLSIQTSRHIQRNKSEKYIKIYSVEHKILPCIHI